MNAPSLTVAVILGATGLLAVLVLLKILFSAIFGDGTGWLERIKIRQKEALAARAELLIGAGDFASALSLLRESFVLSHIRADVKLIERSYNHHLAILGRLIAVADKFSVHLEGLPVVEDLLHSRSQLMKSYLEKKVSRDTIRRRKSASTQGAPNWAVSEFTRQLDELGDKILTNRRSLESQIGRLFSELGKVEKTEEVTYH